MDYFFIILRMKNPRLRELLGSATKAHVIDYYIINGAFDFFKTLLNNVFMQESTIFFSKE